MKSTFFYVVIFLSSLGAEMWAAHKQTDFVKELQDKVAYLAGILDQVVSDREYWKQQAIALHVIGQEKDQEISSLHSQVEMLEEQHN